MKKPLQTALLLVALFFTPAQSKAQTMPSAMNQVKAVYLYNFTQFVSWPPTAFDSSSSPFVIGVLGNDPFGTYLEKIVESERVEGHPIVIKRFANVSEAKNSHILFINKENPREICQQLSGTSVLTVSDNENFDRDGGMIRFYLEKNKIRLQINAKTARAAKLAISSQLLRLANLVDE